MRTSVKSTICLFRRIIPDRHTLWDRFSENRIPHPVMKDPTGDAVKEGSRSFPDKSPSVSAIKQNLFYEHPICYSFFRGRDRYNWSSSRGNQLRGKSPTIAMGRIAFGSLLPFIELLNWKGVTRFRSFALRSMSFRLVPGRVECKRSLSIENHLVTKFPPVLFHSPNQHGNRTPIPEVLKFTAFLWMTTKNFYQAMLTKLKRTSMIQTPLLRSRYMAPM